METTSRLITENNAALAAILAQAQEQGMIVMVPGALLTQLTVAAPPAFVERRQADRRLSTHAPVPSVSNELAATVAALATPPPMPMHAERRQVAQRQRKATHRHARRYRYIMTMPDADLEALGWSGRRTQIMGILQKAGPKGMTCAEIKQEFARQEKLPSAQDAHGTVTQVLDWLRMNAPKRMFKKLEDAADDEPLFQPRPQPVTPVTPVKAKATKRRRRQRRGYTMSRANRLAVSERMTKYWAKRRREQRKAERFTAKSV